MTASGGYAAALRELAELLEKRRVCDMDTDLYVDAYVDEPFVGSTVEFRESELEMLDGQISWVLDEMRKLRTA